MLAALTAPAFADRASEDARLAAVARQGIEDTGLDLEIADMPANRASRTGDKLTLTFTNGRQRVFSDTSCRDSDECVRYRLAADLPSRHAFLLLVVEQDEAHFSLIDDRGGREASLDAVPYFSPDNSKFVLAVPAGDAEAAPVDFQVWRRQGDNWSKEWSYDDATKGHSLSGFDHARVTTWRGARIELAFHRDSEHALSWTGALVQDRHGWRLVR